MKQMNICILMTACINPNGMAYTALQDAKEREMQYKNALYYYLEKTNVPIIFVENTSHDISTEYQRWIDNDRLEYLCFDGNNYNKELGKGYGEYLLLQYALANSKILNNSRYVLKITGRLKVDNINQLLNDKFILFDNVCRCEFLCDWFLKSVVVLLFVKHLSFFVQNDAFMINDSKHISFEHVLHDSLAKHSNIRLIPYFRPIKINGISGTFNKPYEVPTWKDNLKNNISGANYFHKQSGNFPYRVFFMLVNKITKYL